MQKKKIEKRVRERDMENSRGSERKRGVGDCIIEDELIGEI